MGISAVPIFIAIDEQGMIRSERPRLETFEKEFLKKTFSDNVAPSDKIASAFDTDFVKLRTRAEASKSVTDWLAYGDALLLWGKGQQVEAANQAYAQALKVDARHGPSWFRSGVSWRMLYDSPLRKPDAFQHAVEAWGKALELNPNQYIWRRRIQQYGPRLDKPYPFYDWVAGAESAIRQRGETPIILPVRPDGSEIARPTKTIQNAASSVKEPDSKNLIALDRTGVRAEVVVVPSRIKPGDAARIHVTFQLQPGSTQYWNNEAEALRVWVQRHSRIELSEPVLETPPSKSATSREARVIGFEVRLPADAKETITLPAYALYHVCDEQGGSCQYVRLNFKIELKPDR